MTLLTIGITIASGLAAVLSAYFLAIQVRLGQTRLAVLSATRAEDPTGYWSGILANMCVVAVLAGICFRHLLA
jgi:hypothetical protein